MSVNDGSSGSNKRRRTSEEPSPSSHKQQDNDKSTLIASSSPRKHTRLEHKNESRHESKSSRNDNDNDGRYKDDGSRRKDDDPDGSRRNSDDRGSRWKDDYSGARRNGGKNDYRSSRRRDDDHGYRSRCYGGYDRDEPRRDSSLRSDSDSLYTKRSEQRSSLGSNHQPHSPSSRSHRTTSSSRQNDTKHHTLPTDPLLIEQHLNPPLVIQTYPVTSTQGNKKFNVHIIRDDLLEGGTKQRALPKFINHHHTYHEFVYAGPSTGYAQLALAYVCHVLHRRATLFLQTDPSSSHTPPISARARDYGAHVNLYSDTLSSVQDRAKQYVHSADTSDHHVFLLPFGLDSTEYSAFLLRSITDALPPSLIVEHPARMWLTVGSGTLLRVLARIFPNTLFMPVRVGKKLWEDQYEVEVWKRIGGYERIEEIAAPQRFFERVKREEMPPYPSVASYDGKVWQMVKRYGEEGDYVWNVAKDC